MVKPNYINIILKNDDLSTVESTMQSIHNFHAKPLIKLFDLKQMSDLQLYPHPVLHHDGNKQSNFSNSLTESSKNKIRQIPLHFNSTNSMQNMSERSIIPIRTTIISNFMNSPSCICSISTSYESNKISIKSTFKISYKRNIHLNNELLINSPLNQISKTLNRNICEIDCANKYYDNNGASDLDVDGDGDHHHNNSLRHSVNTVFRNNYNHCKLFIQKRLLQSSLPFMHNNKPHLFPVYSSPSTSPLPLPSSNVHYSHYQNRNVLCRTTSYLSKRLCSSSIFTKLLSYFLSLCIVLYLINFLVNSSFSLPDNLIVIHEEDCRQQTSSQIFFYSLLSLIKRIGVDGVDVSQKNFGLFSENPLSRTWPDNAPPF